MRRFLIIAVAVLCGLFSACKNKTDKGAAADKDSLTLLTDAIKSQPQNAEAYYNRADYHFRHSQFDAAESDILQAIKLKDNVSKYYVRYADVKRFQKKLDDAEENLQKALSLDPSNNEARLKLAEIFFYRAGRVPSYYDNCLAVLEEARKLQPYNPNAYLMEAFCYKEKGDTSTYLQRLYQVVSQNPDEIKAHLELGYFCQQRLDPQGIDHYQNALRVDPKNAEINYNLGLLYRDLGDTLNAIAQFKHLIAIVPSGSYVTNAYYNLAYLDLVSGNFKSAIEYFTQALQCDAVFADAYVGRAEAYEALGDWANARADYEQCLQVSANFPAAIDGLNALDKIQK